MLSAVKEQIEIRLRRRRDWWAGSKPSTRNTMNFDTVVFRYFSSNENAFEAFKKGLVDVYAVYTARIWANETIGEKFDKNWIVKRRVKNHDPIGFQGFAMNMRRPPFDDLRVRKAMAHLVDRETMIRTMMFGAYFLHRSYFEDLYDADHPCTNEEFPLISPAPKPCCARQATRPIRRPAFWKSRGGRWRSGFSHATGGATSSWRSALRPSVRSAFR